MPLSAPRRVKLLIVLSAALTLGLSACSTSPTASTTPAAAAAAAPATPRAAAPSTAAPLPALISAQAFGMHYLDISHPYPPVPFGTARVWDMGVTWKDLQPSKGTWSQSGLAKLDHIVYTFRTHGAQPLIVLGMTPAWAAAKCRHVIAGVDWGSKTCAPTSSGATGAWGTYVRTLAKRYAGRVKYFELWNEVTLHSGFNGSITKLAQMQAVAHSIVHHYGAELLAPSVPLHDGTHGMTFLNRFLALPGGTSFDIVNLHLYSAIQVARAGFGPEWTMDQLAAARRVLVAHHVGNRPVWDTEVNVGNAPAGVTFPGTSGAAQITRTYILNIENRVARTIWYAADAYVGWAGTRVATNGYRSRTTAGVAYRALRNMLVGGRAYGCTRTKMGTIDWRYLCRFHLANGTNMLAVWTTGRAFTFVTPVGTQRMRSVVGATSSIGAGHPIRVGHTPVYVLGTFGV